LRKPSGNIETLRGGRKDCFVARFRTDRGGDFADRHSEGAGVFERAATTYERVGPPFFSHYGRGLVDLVEVQPGSRVLDVATGTGAVLLVAAERAGHTGKVIGVDLAQP
jgi:ubiquinone/menaquinone biosynthesis C-methylase UbiE